MNRPILMLRLLVLTLAALLCLCGCGGTGAAQPVNDERAAALTKELKANPSPFFPRIEGVDTLPSALCVVVTVDKVAYFLQDDALPTCAPEAAEAVLLAQMNTVPGHSGRRIPVQPSGCSHSLQGAPKNSGCVLQDTRPR